MPDKMKIPNKRAHRVSEGKHGGGGKMVLSELQKVLLVSGGVAHHTRRGKVRRPVEATKRGRKQIEYTTRMSEVAQAEKAKQRAMKDRAEKREKQRLKETDARAKAASAMHEAS